MPTTDPAPQEFKKQVVFSSIAVVLAGIVIAILISAAFGIVIALIGAILGMGSRFIFKF